MSGVSVRGWYIKRANEQADESYQRLLDTLPDEDPFRILGCAAAIRDFCAIQAKRTFPTSERLARLTGVSIAIIEAMAEAKFVLYWKKGGPGGRSLRVVIPRDGIAAQAANDADEIQDDDDEASTPIAPATVDIAPGTGEPLSGPEKKREDQSRVEEMSSKKSSSERDKNGNQREAVANATTTSDPPGSSSSHSAPTRGTPNRNRHAGDSTFHPDDGEGVLTDEQRRQRVAELRARMNTMSSSADEPEPKTAEQIKAEAVEAKASPASKKELVTT